MDALYIFHVLIIDNNYQYHLFFHQPDLHCKIYQHLSPLGNSIMKHLYQLTFKKTHSYMYPSIIHFLVSMR